MYRRLPKASRTFKVLLGPIIPLVGIVGMVYDAIIFVILAIYEALWSKFKLKLPLFWPLSLEKVMAMEHPAYFQLRQEAARKQREQQERERQVTSHSL